MSHVDDGALHAYLDGALEEVPPARAERIRGHLEVCAKCVARLEVERRVRQDAHRILSLAVPDVEAPSFEELRAYALSDPTDATSRSPRIHRLGWAASIVIAIGLGWLVRDGQLDRRPTEGATASSGASDAVDARAFTAGARPESPEERTPPVRDPVGRSPAGVEVAAASPAAEAIELPPPTATVGPEERVSAPRLPTERPPTVPASSGRTITLPTVDALTVPVLVAATAERRADAPAADRAVVTTLMDVGPTGRRPGPAAEEAVELPAEAPMVVPGVELVSIENLVEGTTPRGVHVVQRLRGGTTVDVYHLPDDAALSSLPPLPAGHDEVRGRRGSEWVVLRAGLDRSTMLELLARLSTPG